MTKTNKDKQYNCLGCKKVIYNKLRCYNCYNKYIYEKNKDIKFIYDSDCDK